MRDIIIDEEFRDLLPPLDKETYKALEENIIANGCMYPLITWNDILIDGHNRYSICTKHNIPFRTEEKSFDSRESVTVWIISNQVARRNLTPVQLMYFRGLHYNTVKKSTHNAKGINQYSEVNLNNSREPQALETAEILSKQYKVHKGTIYADAKATNAIEAIGKISNSAKLKILSGDVAIDKKELKRLADAPEDELIDIAKMIENGTFEKNYYNAVEIETATKAKPDKRTKLFDDFEVFITDGSVGEKYNALIDVTKTGDANDVKAALRAYINALEKIYKSIK